MTNADHDALLTEAVQLAGFIAPHTTHDIVVDKPDRLPDRKASAR